MTKKKLTNKQYAFTVEYPKDFNATQAALRAGYSPKTAYSIGHENLKKPEIKAEIERRMSEMAMSANEALHRLGQQARVTIGDFLDDEGKVDLEQVKRLGHLVKSLTWTKYGPKIEMYDAQSALVHIGRHHKLFTDKLEISVWQKELLDLLKDGQITPEDIINELGPDLAQEFFESAGLHYAGVGAAQEEITEPQEAGSEPG